MSDFAAVRIHSKMTSIFSSLPIISRKRWTAGERSSLLTVARRSRNSSSRSWMTSPSGCTKPYFGAPGPAVFFAMPNAASSRTQFSTSSRIRPNVCISASTSKVSSGRAHMNRRIAGAQRRLHERPGTCAVHFRGIAPRRATHVVGVRHACRFGP